MRKLHTKKKERCTYSNLNCNAQGAKRRQDKVESGCAVLTHQRDSAPLLKHLDDSCWLCLRYQSIQH